MEQKIDSALVESASKGEWLAILALLVWCTVAFLKSDHVPVFIPPRARPILALVLGQVFAGLTAVMGGMSWPAALATGLLATMSAIGVQEIKNALKPSKPLEPPTGPVATSGVVVLALLAFAALTGCGLPAKVETALEASRDVAVFAESCAVEAQGLALDRCETEVCRAEVKAAFVPIADALDLLHGLWCGLSPTSEGC